MDYKLGSLKIARSPIGGVKWSPQERLAIMTGKDVYICSLDSAQRSCSKLPSFNMSLLSVPCTGECNDLYGERDAFIEGNLSSFDWTKFALDRSLTSTQVFLSDNEMVIDLAWPPINVDIGSKSLVAVMTAGHSITVMRYRSLTAEWKVVIRLNEPLQDWIRQQLHARDGPVDYVQAMAHTSMTALAWCQPTFIAPHQGCCQCTEAFHVVSFVAGASMSGSLFLWKIECNASHINATVASEISLTCPWPKKLMFAEREKDNCLLLVGFDNGQVEGLNVKFSAAGCIVAGRAMLWDEADGITVKQCALLGTKGNDIVVALAKGIHIVVLTITVGEDGCLERRQAIVKTEHSSSILSMFCRDGSTLFTADVDGKIMYGTKDEWSWKRYPVNVRRGNYLTGVDLAYDSSMLVTTFTSSKLIQNNDAFVAPGNFTVDLYCFPPLPNVMEFYITNARLQLTTLMREVLRLRMATTKALEPAVTEFGSKMIQPDFTIDSLRRQIFANELLVSFHDNSKDADAEVDNIAVHLTTLQRCLLVATTRNQIENVIKKLPPSTDWDSLPATDINCLIRLALCLRWNVDDIVVLSKCLPAALLSHPGLTASIADQNETIAEIQEDSSLPTNVSDETCMLCNAIVPFKSINSGTCIRGHTWPRCCLTLSIFNSRCCRRCPVCKTYALHPPLIDKASTVEHIVLSQRHCQMCGSLFVNVDVN